MAGDKSQEADNIDQPCWSKSDLNMRYFVVEIERPHGAYRTLMVILVVLRETTCSYEQCTYSVPVVVAVAVANAPPDQLITSPFHAFGGERSGAVQPNGQEAKVCVLPNVVF